MMARLTVDGCQVDYQCFDFVPRHQNIIRSRKGIVFAKNDFHTVCSWVQFPNDVSWKYDVMISEYKTMLVKEKSFLLLQLLRFISGNKKCLM